MIDEKDLLAAAREWWRSRMSADIRQFRQTPPMEELLAAFAETVRREAVAETMRRFGMADKPEACPQCGERFYRPGELDVVLAASAKWHEKRRALEAERLKAAVAQERERCARIADGFHPLISGSPGPLFGAAWNKASESIAAEIRREQP